MNKKTSFIHSSFCRKYIMIFVFAAMMIIFAINSKNFFTVSNLSNTVITQVAAGFLAMGGMFILITNEFDLSLGYNLCFCMIIGAYFCGQGWPAPGVILAMLLTGTIFGLLNGILVVKLQISSFIVTLAVGLTLSGFSQAVSGGGILYISQPQSIINFTRGTIGKNGIGYCVILLLLFFAILEVVLAHTAYGRQLYAVGVSKKIAHLAGIQTDKIRISAFSAAGFFAGLGGLMLMGQLGAASPSYGTSYLLPGYATVFLSTTSFKPGYINVPGVILSMLIVTFGSNGVQMIGGNTAVSNVFQGLLLIFAMWLSTRFSRVSFLGGE
ncbi:MAG: ABC transporter permease [Lachnospiraceae bacterium]|nr:ABC transporter permease [Lachnospiraceae bacterium]